MDSVLVLMAAPGSGAITTEVVDAIRDHGGGAPHWLSPEFCAWQGYRQLWLNIFGWLQAQD